MTVELCDYLEWEGRLYQVIGDDKGQRQIILKSMEKTVCPHCQGILDYDFIHVIPTSPLFEQNAKPIKTIKDK